MPQVTSLELQPSLRILPKRLLQLQEMSSLLVVISTPLMQLLLLELPQLLNWVLLSSPELTEEPILQLLELEPSWLLPLRLRPALKPSKHSTLPDRHGLMTTSPQRLPSTMPSLLTRLLLILKLPMPKPNLHKPRMHARLLPSNLLNKPERMQLLTPLLSKLRLLMS